MNRYEPKSNFVREKLKETEWKDRKYIEDLLRLENYILNRKYYTCEDSMRMQLLASRHLKEYAAILAELTPEGYWDYVYCMEKVDAEYLEELREELEREEIRLRREWLEAGGKP